MGSKKNKYRKNKTLKKLRKYKGGANTPTSSSSPAAPVAAPVAAPIAAPIAAPVAAPVVSPVAAPIAAPVAAPASGSNVMPILSSIISTLQPTQSTHKQIQKIVPSKDENVDILSTTTDGNLTGITLMYNGTSIKNIKITGLEFESGSKVYIYDDKNKTLIDDANTQITNGDLLSAAQYLARLNLAFYTDPNQTHTIP